MANQTIYMKAGDGGTSNRSGVGSGSADWDAAHDGTSANFSAGHTDTAYQCGVAFTDRYYIQRPFFPVALTAVPTKARITKIEVYLYIVSKNDGDNDGDDWINIVGPTTQASSDAVVAEDFDQCGAVNDPQELATRIDIGNLTTSAYNTWTLNSTGIALAQANIGGVLLLGGREGHDALDHQSAANSTDVSISSTEETGTSQDPYILVTYRVPGSPTYIT